MDAITNVPVPYNEPIGTFAPGTPERAGLEQGLKDLVATQLELPNVIGGKKVMASGDKIEVRSPHEHSRVLGVAANSTHADATSAIAAAKAAAPMWRDLPFDERAAVILRAADLLSGPWRNKVLAATVWGQSKTAYQAEIDSTCELIDFWRFNVHFARQILQEQPVSSPGVWNRTDHRSLEGFVYAITPFNFTAIAANLPTAPALMGNTVVWKPSPTQQVAASVTMDLLMAAGLPPGVINMVTGDGIAVSDVALADPDLAGIHFTGSTPVFQQLWKTVGNNIANYKSYPRLVGETGGKDFIFAHPSAEHRTLITAIIRGAFEFQGQKCSAASRAYVPRSIWDAIKDDFQAEVEGIKQGHASDFSNFMTAVIDEKAFNRVSGAIDRAHADKSIDVIAGGTYDKSEGWFIRPTVLVGTDPAAEFFTDEYFGPVIAIHVYEDNKWREALAQMEGVAKYALTGAIIAQDRDAINEMSNTLRFAAGNFYINDKPTGAVVGQQPFGGARASGTNDKAGAAINLMRWTSDRSIKETMVPAQNYQYPFMG
ncbi:MAG: L-glutamate gamma-semialdehyde dehydrogenase [Actinomycetes bacterium]|jgi:1-pyrroline-5-carboxylate dehydrogenase